MERRILDGEIYYLPGISPESGAPDSQRDPRGQTGKEVRKVQGTQTQPSRHRTAKLKTAGKVHIFWKRM